MKFFLTAIFFLISILSVFSCTCLPPSFCDYFESTIDDETSIIFMGSYLNEVEINEWSSAIQFKVENIYRGEIVTETSDYYNGETYVNTDSTIWLLSGSDVSCYRYVDNTTAIFVLRYNSSWDADYLDVGYVPTICATDYFPISNNDEVTGWIWEREDVTMGLAEFETLLEQGCGTVSTVDALDDFNQLSVFPNPVNGILTINCPTQFKALTIELYDNLGNLVRKTNRTSIDMNTLQTGVYFVKIYNEQSSFIEKVMKI